MPILRNKFTGTIDRKNLTPDDTLTVLINHDTCVVLKLDWVRWGNGESSTVLSIDRAMTDPDILAQLDHSAYMELAFRKAGWKDVIRRLFRRLFGQPRELTLEVVRRRTRYVSEPHDTEQFDHSPRVGQYLHVQPIFDDPIYGDIYLMDCRPGIVTSASA